MNRDDRSRNTQEVSASQLLTVLRGLMGAGKTTLATSLAETSPNIAVVCRDTIREINFHRDGLLSRDEEDIVSGIEMAQVVEHLDMGRNVIVDATHLDPDHVQRWVALARARAIELVLVDVLAPVDVCIANVKRRKNQGGRDVDPRVIRDAHRRHPPSSWSPPATFTIGSSTPTHSNHRAPRGRGRNSTAK
ncbi:AAA family ATPase [Nocardia sp. NPDC050710]|uniref:AAA family ATPase n=1 Tax=Nocardia sp. NPDC050710 TaxID=3157220 RepID=UPI0033ECBD42